MSVQQVTRTRPLYGHMCSFCLGVSVCDCDAIHLSNVMMTEWIPFDRSYDGHSWDGQPVKWHLKGYKPGALIMDLGVAFEG